MYELFHFCQMSRTDDIWLLGLGSRSGHWSALASALRPLRVLPLVMVFDVSCCAIYFMDRITMVCAHKSQVHRSDRTNSVLASWFTGSAW